MTDLDTFQKIEGFIPKKDWNEMFVKNNNDNMTCLDTLFVLNKSVYSIAKYVIQKYGSQIDYSHTDAILNGNNLLHVLLQNRHASNDDESLIKVIDCIPIVHCKQMAQSLPIHYLV